MTPLSSSMERIVREMGKSSVRAAYIECSFGVGRANTSVLFGSRPPAQKASGLVRVDDKKLDSYYLERGERRKEGRWGRSEEKSE